MGDNWQQVNISDSIFFCERCGFSCKEIDPFAMEIKEFFLPGTKIEFKYKIQNSDPVKFFIWPRVDGKDVTVKEFKEAVVQAKSK